MLSYFQRKRMLYFKLYVLERQSFLLALVEIFGNRGRYANTFFVALFCIRVDKGNRPDNLSVRRLSK